MIGTCSPSRIGLLRRFRSIIFSPNRFRYRKLTAKNFNFARNSGSENYVTLWLQTKYWLELHGIIADLLIIQKIKNCQHSHVRQLLKDKSLFAKRDARVTPRIRNEYFISFSFIRRCIRVCSYHLSAMQARYCFQFIALASSPLVWWMCGIAMRQQSDPTADRYRSAAADQYRSILISCGR